MLLWPWRRPPATTLIRPLACEPPYAASVALKRQKTKKKKKKKKATHTKNSDLEILTLGCLSMRQPRASAERSVLERKSGAISRWSRRLDGTRREGVWL